MIVPKAKMSLRASISFPSSCSGAMYCSMPRIIPSPVITALVGKLERLELKVTLRTSVRYVGNEHAAVGAIQEHGRIAEFGLVLLEWV